MKLFRVVTEEVSRVICPAFDGEEGRIVLSRRTSSSTYR